MGGPVLAARRHRLLDPSHEVGQRNFKDVGEPHKGRQARAVQPALPPGYLIRVDEQAVAQLMLR